MVGAGLPAAAARCIQGHEFPADVFVQVAVIELGG